MIINLIPEFLDAVQKPDPVAGYFEHLERHKSVISAYWNNYVVDPFGPNAEKVVEEMVGVPWNSIMDIRQIETLVDDLTELMDILNKTYSIDFPIDIYLSVGAGTVQIAELVENGKGVLVVCLEHFSAQTNPKDIGRRLPWELLRIWVAHGVAHLVRFSSKTSDSEIRNVIAETHGSYDHWEVGSRVTLGELLVNEGLAIAGMKKIEPRKPAHVYLDYGAAAYKRIRRMESFLRRTVQREIDSSGVGYRLRYFTRGSSSASRLIDGRLIPERSGYYLGYRLIERKLGTLDLADALRAAPHELLERAV
ncbi:MAG: DUF2268 domain-containing protein [Gemmatimonadota bacterium]|nr:DUF2268 domain-containing protein [Gemmatimonadota bacterium]MDH5804406.1 DUF2268 domain-containing protein [Gemmatimonadota bacterium]